MIRFLIISLLLVSCGASRIDPELRPYIAEVLSWCSCEMRPHLSAEFSDLSDPHIGRCSLNKITIDRTAWINLSENYRLQLIAHELGHCNFGQFWHTDTGLMKASGFENRPAKDVFLEWYNNR